MHAGRGPNHHEVPTATHGATRFAQTPKFSFPAAVEPLGSEESAIQDSDTSGRLKHFRAERSFDSIEEPPSQVENPESEDEMLLDSVENDTEIVLEQREASSPIRSPKRPRLRSHEHSPDSVSLSPRTVRMSARFRPSTTQMPSPSALTSNTPIPSRLLFVEQSAPVDDSQSDPLPQAFSPHRKSQKFLPNGLAASMRSIIVEATSTQSNPHRWRGGWRVRANSVTDGPSIGMTTVQGTTENGSEEHVLLVGKRDVPQAGQSVVVKGVSWDVELRDIRWVVTVDWVVER